MLRSLTLLTAVTLLSACQTTSTPGGLATPDAKLLNQIIAQSCITSRSRGGETKLSQAITDQKINSLNYGEDGWVSTDVTTRGIRDNVYVNLSTTKVICGYRNYRQSGVNFTRLEPQPTSFPGTMAPAFKNLAGKMGLTSITSGTGSKTSGSSQPITLSPSLRQLKKISWQDETPTAGGIDPTSGKLEIVLNETTHCEGYYRLASNDLGSWTLSCDNDLTAEGMLTRGNVIVGLGSDSQKRSVSFHFTER